MPRRKRSYLPGGAFHITACTHSGEFWFEELRSEIVDIIALALMRTDALLLAFAIMSNHIHLVVRQGSSPLAHLMQPVGQRIAYAVHRRHRRKGYVLDYRYFDTPCSDEAHLRNAIMYTHRNPVAAGLCNDALEYEWSSARAYASGSGNATRLAALQPAIELFASGLPDRTIYQDYLDFYAWYDASKRLGPGEPRPHSPGVTDGDVYWMQNFGTTRVTADRPRTDLRDIVDRALAESKPEVTLERLRQGAYSRRLVAIRNAIIARARHAGHRSADIAHYLNTSDSTVSRVRSSLIQIQVL
jgi:REP element-mobilizing transposase RayT